MVFIPFSIDHTSKRNQILNNIRRQPFDRLVFTDVVVIQTCFGVSVFGLKKIINNKLLLKNQIFLLENHIFRSSKTKYGNFIQRIIYKFLKI